MKRDTPPRTPRISGLKSQVFKITLAPLELHASLSCRFSVSWQIFLRWAAATLKGLGEFQNKGI